MKPLKEKPILKSKTKLIRWPTPQEYNEAVQSPAVNFSDEALRHARPELTPLGLPRPNTGMFASVYRLSQDSNEWAVRCFLHHLPDQHYRYNILQQYLSKRKLSFILPFEHQAQGIKCGHHWFPVLKMQWCHGDMLMAWISKNIDKPESIHQMAEKWKNMILTMNSHGIAHGDLQHGNVIVQNGQLKLIDYDGMYVPELAGMKANELGHQNYQHPDRTEAHYGPDLDNFSAWLIYLSLKCIARDPGLLSVMGNSDEYLLLSRRDFDKPLKSRAFHLLENHRDQEIRQCSRTIRHFLSLGADQIPSLNTEVALSPDLPPVVWHQSDLPAWIQPGIANIFEGQDDRALGRFSEGKGRSTKHRGHNRKSPAAVVSQPRNMMAKRVEGPWYERKIPILMSAMLVFGCLGGMLQGLSLSNFRFVSDADLTRNLELPAARFDRDGQLNLIAEGNQMLVQKDPYAKYWFKAAIEALTRKTVELSGVESHVNGSGIDSRNTPATVITKSQSPTSEHNIHHNLALAHFGLGNHYLQFNYWVNARDEYQLAAKEWESCGETDCAGYRSRAVFFARADAIDFSICDTEGYKRALSQFDRRALRNIDPRWDQTTVAKLTELVDQVEIQDHVAINNAIHEKNP